MARSMLQAVSTAVFGLSAISLPLANAAAVSSTATSARSQYTLPASVQYAENVIPNINDPQAVDAQSVCPGYKATNVQNSTFGLTATLSLAGTPCNLYGTDIDTLNLTVQYQTADRLSVNIVPTYVDSSNYTQYLVRDSLLAKPALDEGVSETSKFHDLSFSWSNDPTFAFTVQRRSTGDVLFTTEGSKLIFENQFLEFTSPLPDDYNIYGLGEHIHEFRLGNNFTATIFPADIANPIDYNIYGSHPFYLETRYFEVDPKTGNTSITTGNATDPSKKYESYSHGVYLRNTHAHEVLLRPNRITWRTLGGSIDLYFYAGPTQPAVTKALLKSNDALPAMQQYYTLGYQQCRWGYKGWSDVEDVASNFSKFEIPLETLWVDIDYLGQLRDFQTDPNTWSIEEGEKFLSSLHSKGQHFVPIIDSAIYIPNPDNASDAYAPFDRGNEVGAFLKNPDGSLYIGAVWPGFTVFPDWLSEGAQTWWVDEITAFHEKVSFDGIWIDMSEISSFCAGSCGSGNLHLQPVHPPFALPGEPGAVVYDYPEGFNITNATEAASASSGAASQSSAASVSATTPASTPIYRPTVTPGVRDVNHPAYVINNGQGDIANKAISPNATHIDGTQEYEMHNVWGYQILNATHNALLNIFPEKRPFIIGRSTFFGSGRWAGHWGGDNYSKWGSMYMSISQALSFSLFGIPMFGVDTCGFLGNSDEELCNRWMQLSAFFPFYRNHNTLSTIPQEPYRWGSVIESTKTAMKIRYPLLPYMYTLLHLAHSTGSTVLRALSWEFPNDPLLANVDTQLLLGPSILVIPVLEPQVSTVQGVFPGIAEGEKWYDWYTQTPVSATAGKNETIDAPLGHIPVYVRGGSVLPQQEYALTTRDARNTPYSLITALSAKGTAKGELYVDDGESVKPNATLFVEYAAENNTLTAVPQGAYVEPQPLANITVLGVPSAPLAGVTFNGVKLPSSSVAYNGTSHVLSVTGLKNYTAAGAWAHKWTLKW
ncbi:glycoside hydrolase family 31 protein [Xylona heveae TC161]|uniref:alpha-glucosidase n=1 Tax=Xylona heveae (strain CBS 132557 / TC161) TaxID=1328760 RepID=A0A165HDG7_XYLHT|nr:glycoside hydrolase family 31 protein [Xylona heveae TC161]KZF23342.1 glycoside hydrolase family 31 protein [Xylona heveae TC161]